MIIRKILMPSSPARKVGVWLLVIVFLSIPLAQLLHGHLDGHVPHRASQKGSEAGLSSKCRICDYLFYTQKKFFITHDQPTVHLGKIHWAFIYTPPLKVSVSVIPAFSNKGPPRFFRAYC
jgi:hypothetical protein